ncbi:hypothetical protein FRC03_001763, partial [Tulasnella sp. 419]
LEYLTGGTRRDLLKLGPYSEARLALMCRELLMGLDYLYGEGRVSERGMWYYQPWERQNQPVTLHIVCTPFCMLLELFNNWIYSITNLWSLEITTTIAMPTANLH